MLDEREAVHDRHHQVEDDGLGPPRAHRFEGFATMGREIDGVALLAQRIADQPADCWVVVHYQDVRMRHASEPPEYAINAVVILRLTLSSRAKRRIYCESRHSLVCERWQARSSQARDDGRQDDRMPVLASARAVLQRRLGPIGGDGGVVLPMIVSIRPYSRASGRAHPVVAIDVLRDALDVLPGIGREQLL